MANILPPAKTQFSDANGAPLAGGSVYFYIPGTTTTKPTWQDDAQTIPNSNPVVLDGSGEAVIFGLGSYRQIVNDSLGNLIWDQLTYGYVSVAMEPVVGAASLSAAITALFGGAAPSFATGTVLPFLQAAAPSGWTQVFTFNDVVLRINATGGDTGGSWVITGSFGSTDGHALLTAELAAHTHTYADEISPSVNPFIAQSAGVGHGFGNQTLVSGSTGSGTAHVHTLGAITSDGVWRPAYVDAIACAKD